MVAYYKMEGEGGIEPPLSVLSVEIDSVILQRCLVYWNSKLKLITLYATSHTAFASFATDPF